MRLYITLVILLAMAGCSQQLPTEHHILPVGFSGVYKIEKASGNSDGYRIEGNRHIFTIPESGELSVAPDIQETCLMCQGVLRVTYEDGQEIPLFSPIKQPEDSDLNRPMWLGLIKHKDAVWCAVGTHSQLSYFLKQVRAEMYQNLEQYLPPNSPFQSQGEVSDNL